MSGREGARSTANPRPWWSRWARTHGRRALLTLPSLALLAYAGWVAVDVSEASNADLVARYRLLLREATVEEDEAKRTLLAERIARLNPANEDRQALVEVLFAAGEQTRAYELLLGLAPRNRPGHASSQIWLARALLQGKLPRSRARIEAEAHLIQALRARPESTEAHALLGGLYSVTNRRAEALEHLERAIADHPELRLVLAETYKALGRESDAAAEARAARDFFESKLRSAPRDRVSTLRVATASVLLKDFVAAERDLKELLKEEDMLQARRLLAQTYAAWSDAVAREKSSDQLERLRLVSGGLEQAPEDLGLLERLRDVAQTKGPASGAARELLQRELAKGGARPVLRYVLGELAFVEGRQDEAREHWDEAVRMMPSMNIFANNLAWTLSEANPPQLDRALEVIDRALKAGQQLPSFRGTRGHVLVKLGRFSEALPDLEFALPFEDKTIDIHKDLAQAYQALGMTELASVHTQRAEVLRAGPERGQTGPGPTPSPARP